MKKDKKKSIKKSTVEKKIETMERGRDYFENTNFKDDKSNNK